MNDDHEECSSCPHRGQCDMQCYNPYSVWWTPDDGGDEE